jgi:hypothetical protein
VLKLILAHGRVRAERGKNGLEPVAVILTRIHGQFAGARMFAALVGRHGEHVLPLSELGQDSPESRSFNSCGDRSVSTLPVAQ